MFIMCSSAIISLLAYAKKNGSQSDIFMTLYNFPKIDFYYASDNKKVNNYRKGTPIDADVENLIKDVSPADLANYYKKYLIPKIEIRQKRNLVLAIRKILELDPTNNDTFINEELKIKKGELLKGSHVCLHYLLAILMLYCAKNSNYDTYSDVTESFLNSFNSVKETIYFDDEPLLKSKSIELMDSTPFTNTFINVPIFKSIEVNNPSRLEIYHLKLSDKTYNYAQASNFIHSAITSYINSRIKIDEVKENNEFKIQFNKSFLKFLKLNKKDSFPNIMLYAFLESVLNAPKILSSYEITKAPKEHETFSSGIHLLPKEVLKVGNNKLIFGSSNIDNDFITSIEKVFDQIVKIEKNKDEEINFIDENIFRYCFSTEDAKYLSSLLLPNYGGVKPDMSFGIFIAFKYTIENKGSLSNEDYQNELTKQLQETIKLKLPTIQNKIDSLGLKDYSFFIYLLPLEDVDSDTEKIYEYLGGD